MSKQTISGTVVPFKYMYPHAHLPLLTGMDVPSTMLMQVLHKALTMRRASGSVTEAQFVAWLCNRLPISLIDEAGNIHVDLRRGSIDATMFTAHTDTAHRDGGVNKIRLDKTDPRRTLWRADEGHCLGADDGAGIALMMHMIEARVPGYYVFFRGEEVGGTGSTWLADHMLVLCQEFDACVSFDRADYSDVISRQGYGRCCSDTYARALGDALTTEDLTLAFMPCDGGVFTDSANLTHLIPECTNLSVGYCHQHGDGEWQDVTFLQALAQQLVTVAWTHLPIERNPLVVGSAYQTLWKAKSAYQTSWKAKSWESPIGDDESPLVNALIDAQAGKYSELRGAVAAHLLPDDVDGALKHIDPTKLMSADYAFYEQELTEGIDEYSILDELITFLYVE